MENDMDLSTVFGTYRSFEDWLKDPENPHVYCLLTMDGKKFLAKESYHVELHQKTNAHDTFKITVNDDAIDSFTGFVLENSKNMLGNEITITYHQYGQIMQSFTGIIGGINNNKKGTGYGDLIITGFSPSILLESGKDCRSFESKTLEQIIKEVCEIYPTESRVKVELPNVKQVLPYTVQYKESDYEFIQRLAKRHGEFLYYDGEQLLFGREIQPIVKLREGDELLGIKYALKIGAQDFSYLAYDAETGEKIEQDSASIQAQYKTDPFQSVAENRSKPLFKKKPKMHFNQTGIIDGQAKNELEEAVRLEKERRASLMQITGKSIAPFLRMGSLAEFTDINKHAMETYRILEISHYHNGGSYYNEFTGIPDVFTAPYSDEDAFPKGEEQPARV
ncbi:MAG: Rhs element Vgr protein, partial [Flavobacteriaceae bacterium]|nr:Rhs element Vgr protein [Flavobacteriaceae bacterium]